MKMNEEFKIENVDLERDLYVIDFLYLNWFLVWLIMGFLDFIGFEIVAFGSPGVLIPFLKWLFCLFIGFGVIYLFGGFFNLRK